MTDWSDHPVRRTIEAIVHKALIEQDTANFQIIEKEAVDKIMHWVQTYAEMDRK